MSAPPGSNRKKGHLLSTWAWWGAFMIIGKLAALLLVTGPAENAITESQVAMAIGIVVLVLLVLILIVGFFIHAIDNETPEQKLQRKLNQQELGELAKCVGVYYATTEALKKLK
jgi:amino acid transporter